MTKETQFIDILRIDFITLIKGLSQIQDSKTIFFSFQGGKWFDFKKSFPFKEEMDTISGQT